MYENYFRLRELPFNVTPDPRFFYTNSSCQEAFATLCYGIEQAKGIILLTGEAGTGKTTLLKRFMQNEVAAVRASCILDPHLSFAEILHCTLDAFAVAHVSADRFVLIERLKDYLIEQWNDRQRVALLLDEAQDLDDSVFEELRLLSDIEHRGAKLLQVVLIGQPELEARLDQPALHQLRQRITLRSRLAPLGLDEIGPYIDFRLNTAGYAGKALFQTAAIQRIGFFSKGIPRLINVICDNALLIACVTGQEKVGAEMIDEVAEDLQLGARGLSVWQPALSPVPAAPPRAEALEELDSADEDKRHEIIAPPERQQWPVPDRLFAADEISEARPPTPVNQLIRQWWLELSAAAMTIIVLFIGGMYLSQPDSATALAPVTDRIEQLQEVFAPLPGRIYRVITARPLWDDSFKDAATEERIYPKRETPEPFLEKRVVRDRGQAAKPVRSLPRNEPRERLGAAEKTASGGEHPNPERRSARRSPEAFSVTSNSFVRDKPTSEAAVIATLRPGTRIQIVGKTGDYLRVRSLESEAISGYVHKEDAFFEPFSGGARRAGKAG